MPEELYLKKLILQVSNLKEELKKKKKIYLNLFIFHLEYSPEEINTAVGHVIHMLGLVAHYLGVKLPYTLVNKGSNSYAEGSLSEITER